jgi:hypothetical protein
MNCQLKEEYLLNIIIETNKNIFLYNTLFILHWKTE